MKLKFKIWAIGAAFLLSLSAASAQYKAIYHIDNAETQATKGLRNVRNHLDVAPETKIMCSCKGVDFLMEALRIKLTPILITPHW